MPAAVAAVAPAAAGDKALQVPIRESIQQRPDRAIFARRADAVENERAIKQNELSTEIELARRQEDLIQREGANRLLETQHQVETDRVRTTAELAREALVAEAYARDQRTHAEADALTRSLLSKADADGEALRVAVWQAAPTRVLLGLAAQEFAGKIGSINHLNLTLGLPGSTMQLFLQGQADQQAVA